MGKKPRTVVHSDKVLRKASDYFELDLHSLAATFDMLRRIPPQTEVRNAVVDSFLIRSRLLIDFLCRDQARNDDVIALDYFHDFSPKPYRPYMSKELDREREKINKRLVHLTVEPMPRLRSKQRYHPRKIVRPIVRAMKKWLSDVPDARLQKGVRADYEKHLRRIERVL